MTRSPTLLGHLPTKAGYPTMFGYLARYLGQRYHVPDWRRGATPSGEQETFNYFYSSIHNVIERAFGAWKMKWRTLLKLPSYPMSKQKMIVAATMCLHNFICENHALDMHLLRCDQDPDYGVVWFMANFCLTFSA
jgi:hypothetical protein